MNLICESTAVISSYQSVWAAGVVLETILWFHHMMVGFLDCVCGVLLGYMRVLVEVYVTVKNVGVSLCFCFVCLMIRVSCRGVLWLHYMWNCGGIRSPSTQMIYRWLRVNGVSNISILTSLDCCTV